MANGITCHEIEDALREHMGKSPETQKQLKQGAARITEGCYRAEKRLAEQGMINGMTL